jgi:hypothetical protein
MAVKITIKEISKLFFGAFIINLIYATFLFFWAKDSDLKGLPSVMSPFDKFVNMFYFAIATFTTTGYGDISPASTRMKIINVFYMLLVLSGLASFLFKF